MKSLLSIIFSVMSFCVFAQPYTLSKTCNQFTITFSDGSEQSYPLPHSAVSKSAFVDIVTQSGDRYQFRYPRDGGQGINSLDSMYNFCIFYDCCGCSSGGGDGDCACGIEEIEIHDDDTLTLDISDTSIGKYYLNFTGDNWTFNLPDISTAGYRGVEIYAVFDSGQIIVNPFGTDAIADNGAGNSLTGNVTNGSSGMLWIANANTWGVTGGGGGGGTGLTVDKVFIFTTTDAKTDYSIAEIITALTAGTFPGSLSGRVLTTVTAAGAEWATGGNVSISGGGGLTFTSNPGTQTFVVQFI